VEDLLPILLLGDEVVAPRLGETTLPDLGVDPGDLLLGTVTALGLAQVRPRDLPPATLVLSLGLEIGRLQSESLRRRHVLEPLLAQVGEVLNAQRSALCGKVRALAGDVAQRAEDAVRELSLHLAPAHPRSRRGGGEQAPVVRARGLGARLLGLGLKQRSSALGGEITRGRLRDAGPAQGGVLADTLTLLGLQALKLGLGLVVDPGDLRARAVLQGA
jgi:hypothetical protein